jgi:hypothetical protein
LRHPGDQLAALYTQIPEPMTEHWANNPVFPVPNALYRAGLDTDAAMAMLIGQGYLHSALKWAADWLHLRDRERSRALRFEDFVADRRGFFESLSRFLFGRGLDDAAWADLGSIDDDYAEVKRRRNDGRQYTRGYSGKAGIRGDYYNDENRRLYRRVVETFLADYPHASGLRSLYPDILDFEA